MRVYTSTNSPLDFCAICAPTEALASSLYGNIGDEPDDGRGNCFSYDTEHPDYESWRYRCYYCGATLTEKD